MGQFSVQINRVDIHLLPPHLISLLLGEELKFLPANNLSSGSDCLVLSIPARYKRTGMEMKLLVDGPSGNNMRREPDRSLIKLIVKAHRLKRVFIHNHGHNVKALAKQHRVNASYFTRLIRLTFLAPDITQAILEGRHPLELTAAKLIRNTRFPLDWREQRKMLGFA